MKEQQPQSLPTKEQAVNHVLPISTIQLRGEPYQRNVDGESIDCNQTAEDIVRSTGYEQTLPERIAQAEGLLQPLFSETGFYTIDRKIKQAKDLSFSEAFSLVTFVCTALNRPLSERIGKRIQALGPKDTHMLQATALLSAMSAKEAYVGLTPDEIAGMVAATIHLDTFIRVPSDEPIIAFGGMGGDKGYPMNGESTKLFSLSTLAAIALAADGPVHKHHSYPNTSKVAGQSAIEALGARSDFHTRETFLRVLRESSLLMTSCHDTRTLHTLSHLLRGETVNHVIGPLAFTLSESTPVIAMIGVNEKVHPQVAIEAIEILDKTGFQHYESAVVFSGTDLESVDPQQVMYSAKNRPFLLEHTRIDEVAPPPFSTIASFYLRGRNLGTYILQPSDFYEERDLQMFDRRELEIHNSFEEIQRANVAALGGKDYTKTRYLAMTVGLGLFVRSASGNPDAFDFTRGRVNRDLLRACTKKALSILYSGQAHEALDQYVDVTNRYAGKHI